MVVVREHGGGGEQRQAGACAPHGPGVCASTNHPGSGHVHGPDPKLSQHGLSPPPIILAAPASARSARPRASGRAAPSARSPLTASACTSWSRPRGSSLCCSPTPAPPTCPRRCGPSTRAPSSSTWQRTRSIAPATLSCEAGFRLFRSWLQRFAFRAWPCVGVARSGMIGVGGGGEGGLAVRRQSTLARSADAHTRPPLPCASASSRSRRR